MPKYDLFIAGHWRDYPEVKKALNSVQALNTKATVSGYSINFIFHQLGVISDRNSVAM